MRRLVDVIVPVFLGINETQRCLNSLLNSRQNTDHEIVVINDASPDPRIHELLQTLRQQSAITLIHHAENRGFVASVNEAFDLHPERDVVVLNNDTEVANDWLDRLASCAASRPHVGTVTPFTNNGTICSYPTACHDNDLPSDMTVAELDDLFRELGREDSVELPTAVGFCMYIRRVCIDAVGYFDEALFGRGYGEEVDFCLRAAGLGYKHLLCTSTYVYHKGAVSFGHDAWAARTTSAQRVVDELYPEYSQRIQTHVAEDPARGIRRAVDRRRIATSSKPRVLLVSHAWGGGVQRHVEELARLLVPKAHVLLLAPYSDRVHILRWMCDGEGFEVYFDLSSEYRLLVDYLRGIGISRVHYHHVHGFPATVLSLAEHLGAPYWCTLHDYYPICPQYNLNSAEGLYCEEPSREGCDLCLQLRPSQWSWDIVRWRTEFGEFLRNAELVITPTDDVASRIARYVPGLNLVTKGHPEVAEDVAGGTFEYFSPDYRKIAILGHLTSEKGLETVCACAKDAAETGLSLTFRVIGTIGSPGRMLPSTPISITGQFEETEIDKLVREERPDAFFFPSSVPETYSYTLSTAKKTGLPIVAVKRGAFPERLEDYPNAFVRSPDTSPSEWNRLFRSIPSAFPLASAYRTTGKPAPDNRAEYLNFYLSHLRKVLPQDKVVALTADHYRFPEERRLPAPSIETLLTDTLDRGLHEASEQLRRLVRETAERIEQQQATISEKDRALSEKDRVLLELKETLRRFESAHNEHVGHLEKTIGGLRRRVQEVEQSTFWRISYPLRVVAHRLKKVGARFGAARYQFYDRGAKAIEIFRHQGADGLIQEFLQWWKQDRIYEPESERRQAISPGKEIYPLRMPRDANPKVSIIVPTYGHYKVTFACLESIAKHTAEIPVEIILVDDCFTEPAKTALDVVENLILIRNEVNLGFLKSCNRAVDHAVGEFVLFLNNDTLVGEHWLAHLLFVFDRFDDVGAVGAKLLFPDGTLQEAGGIVWRDATAWNFGRGKDAAAPQFNYLRDVDYCSGACLLLPRQLFLDLGRFDERFAPAYFEDTDICFSIRATGKRVIYQPKSEVVHFEGVSHGTDENTGLKCYQERNRERFVEKWRTRLNDHLENGVMPERARDRDVVHRMLWVEACMLTPDQDSGSLRTARLLRLLSQMRCKVTFVADNLELRQPYVDELQQCGVEVLYEPYLSSVKAYLKKTATQYDTIVLCRHYVAIKYVDLVRRLSAHTRIVFDTIDLHYVRLRRQLSLEANATIKKLAATAYRNEIEIICKSDVTLVVSDVEKELLSYEVPKASVLVVSNVHDPVDQVAPPTERKDILFVGGFQHPPNIDAVCYYAREIWPSVRRALPGVDTYIIGSRMPEDLARTGAEAGLKILGYVPDLGPYLTGCRVSISPLRYGAGVKGKVNQSMSYGLPVVATSVSIEGMSLIPDQDILVADEAEAFAQAVVRLYTDDELWRRLSRAGLRNVEERFSSTTARDALDELLTRLGPTG